MQKIESIYVLYCGDRYEEYAGMEQVIGLYTDLNEALAYKAKLENNEDYCDRYFVLTERAVNAKPEPDYFLPEDENVM